jgi:hypothetical protein
LLMDEVICIYTRGVSDQNMYTLAIHINKCRVLI